MAAALIVSLPASAALAEEAPDALSPAGPAAPAAVLPGGPRLFTTVRLPWRSARPAAVAVAAKASAGEADQRASRPASRSMTRRTVHRVERRAVRVVHRVARHVERRAAPVRRVVHRKVVRVAGGPGRGRLAAVVAYARAHVGDRYVWGGEGGRGYDCSGLVKKAYAAAGIALPHSARGQAARARVVSRSKARPGDLVVAPGHVGIYMGGGMVIDAGNERVGVVYRKTSRGWRTAQLR